MKAGDRASSCLQMFCLLFSLRTLRKGSQSTASPQLSSRARLNPHWRSNSLCLVTALRAALKFAMNDSSDPRCFDRSLRRELIPWTIGGYLGCPQGKRLHKKSNPRRPAAASAGLVTKEFTVGTKRQAANTHPTELSRERTRCFSAPSLRHLPPLFLLDPFDKEVLKFFARVDALMN